MHRLPDPMDTLEAFQKCVVRAGLPMQPCEIHPGIKVFSDSPKGIGRLTYARVEHGRTRALAVYVVTDPFEGLPCFNIGYAVPEFYRGQGLATDVLRKSIDELRAGLARNGISRFYIEAVVSIYNEASMRVAGKVLAVEPEGGVDSNTGDPIWIYRKLVD